jgi:hypothetical protein
MGNCFCHIAVKTATGKEEITMQLGFSGKLRHINFMGKIR